MDLNDKKHPMTQQMEGYVLRFSTVASVQHATFPKFNIEPQNRFCWQVRNDPKFPGFPSFWTIGGGNLGHTTVKVSRCCAGWIWIIACRMVECTSRPIFWESRFFLRPPEGGSSYGVKLGSFSVPNISAFIFPGGQSARTFYWRCFSGIWKSKMDVLTLQNQHHGLASDSCDHSLAKEAGNVGCVWASIGGKDLSKRWVAMIWREFPFSKASCLVSIHWLVVRCTIVDRRRTCTCTGDG